MLRGATITPAEHLPSSRNWELMDCGASSASIRDLGAETMNTLRRYAYSSGGRWHGICTDLDIAVESGSCQEIESSLGICIKMYLESISELPAGERRRLLARRAPWHLRAWLAISTWIHQLKRTSDRPAQSFFLESHVIGPS